MAMGPVMAISGVDVLIPPSALTMLFGSLAAALPYLIMMILVMTLLFFFPWFAAGRIGK